MLLWRLLGHITFVLPVGDGPSGRFGSKGTTMYEYRWRDSVEIFGTNSYLDGQIATVVGVAAKHPEFSSYILELEEDIRRLNPDKWGCIVLTESCFRPMIPF